jgi:hypothetical protein
MSNKKNAVIGSVPSITSTGAGSAGNTATTAGGGSTPPAGVAGAPVVAPKGFRLQLQQMLQGWQSVIPAGSSLPQVGGALAQATVVSELQTYLGAYNALDASELAAKGTRAAVVQQTPGARALYTQLKEALVGFYGSGSPALAQFGLKPRSKAKPLTAAQKAAMVGQMLQTRKARGIIGKRQRAAVKAGPVTVTLTSTSAAAPTSVAPTEEAPAQGSPPGTTK